ncbi:DciA family protein [Kitasatospora sp. NPDC001660]
MSSDIARAALQAARAAARHRPTADPLRRTPARQPRRAAVRDGREPVGLAAVFTGLVAERAWELSATGGNLLDQWPAIAPELVDKVTATHFDPATGRLDLQPVSPAYGTQLRLLGSQLVARINAKLGTEAVRSIRVLAPRPLGPARTPAAPVPLPTVAPPPAPAPVRTRDSASAGYRQALAALQAARTPPRIDPGIAAAVERQDQALRERREPENAFADALAYQADQAVAQDRAAAAATSQALAVRRARAERAGAIHLRTARGTPNADQAGAA